MQVKVFHAQTPDDLEQAIAAWLAAHPAITLTCATQAPHGVASFGGQPIVQLVLTIFYTESPAGQAPEQRDRSGRPI